MTNIIVSVLSWLEGMVGKLPDLSIDSGVLSQLINGMNRVIDFVKVANFIVPLDHILIIMGLMYTIRSRKFLIAIINWVIRRIADLIP